MRSIPKEMERNTTHDQRAVATLQRETTKPVVTRLLRGCMFSSCIGSCRIQLMVQ